MKIKYYEDDLPANIDFGDIVAIDTETMGLKPHRDRLCLVQICNGDDVAHIVQISNKKKSEFKYLKKLLKKTKLNGTV